MTEFSESAKEAAATAYHDHGAVSSWFKCQCGWAPPGEVDDFEQQHLLHSAHRIDMMLAALAACGEWIDYKVKQEVETEVDERMVRDPVCVERWPGCFSFGYDLRCCRFPKSCSCMVFEKDLKKR